MRSALSNVFVCEVPPELAQLPAVSGLVTLTDWIEVRAIESNATVISPRLQRGDQYGNWCGFSVPIGELHAHSGSHRMCCRVLQC
jgi:hypothetical protein